MLSSKPSSVALDLVELEHPKQLSRGNQIPEYGVENSLVALKSRNLTPSLHS